MQDITLALRNIWRNRRRSVATIMAMALSCGGLALFGGYISWTFRAVEEQTVGSYGHVQIYKKGYFEEGAGDPTSYALDNYEEIKEALQKDPVIGPALELVTGQLVFNGIVTSAETRTSSTFYGLGVFPSEDSRLWQWNPYELFPAKNLRVNAPVFDGPEELDDADTSGGSVGIGMGRILRLGHPAEPKAPQPSSLPSLPAGGPGDEVDMSFLMKQGGSPPKKENRASVELMVSPPGSGMPGVATVGIRRIAPRATKELDDQLIKLPIKQASEVLFPGQPLHVTTVVVLLKRTEDTDKVLLRLNDILGGKGLEFKIWTEVRPFYLQIKRMLGIIFVFVFTILATLMAFTIYNTQSASIIERLGELGTLRALGVTRLGLWKLLLLEGVFLGLIGAMAGIVLAILGDSLLRAVDIVYIPPGVSFYAKVEVLVLRNPAVIVMAFAGTLFFATLSAAIPARRAARMKIVDALRHG